MVARTCNLDGGVGWVRGAVPSGVRKGLKSLVVEPLQDRFGFDAIDQDKAIQRRLPCIDFSIGDIKPPAMELQTSAIDGFSYARVGSEVIQLLQDVELRKLIVGSQIVVEAQTCLHLIER